MNIFDLFHNRIAEILTQIMAKGYLEDFDARRFVVEPPKDVALGDLACNAAMVFAKESKKHFSNPKDFANEICRAISSYDDVEKADVAGPGFINIYLKADVYVQILRSLLRDPKNYGRSAQGRNGATHGKVNIEYVSANPTGPMHVGHGRGAVFGDALANLLAFSGSDVTREYYINDAGAQINVLAQSAFMRYREALGEQITIAEGLYPGDYLKPLGEQLFRTYGSHLLEISESECLQIVKETSIDAMMALIRSDPDVPLYLYV